MSTSTNDPKVSQTIFRQLGGGSFLAMTGARDMSYDSRSLMMRLPKAKDSIRFVRVALTDADVYELTAFNAKGDELAPRRDEIMVENLRQAFEEMTGLRCSL